MSVIVRSRIVLSLTVLANSMRKDAGESWAANSCTSGCRRKRSSVSSSINETACSFFESNIKRRWATRLGFSFDSSQQAQTRYRNPARFGELSCRAKQQLRVFRRPTCSTVFVRSRHSNLVLLLKIPRSRCLQNLLYAGGQVNCAHFAFIHSLQAAFSPQAFQITGNGHFGIRAQIRRRQFQRQR